MNYQCRGLLKTLGTIKAEYGSLGDSSLAIYFALTKLADQAESVVERLDYSLSGYLNYSSKNLLISNSE